MKSFRYMLAVAAGLVAFTTFAGGEYQGWEPLPRVADIRFNKDAIAFLVAENDFVPGGPRYFELPRGARDWQRISMQDFYARFPSRRLPARIAMKDESTDTRFTVLTTSDAEHFISTDYLCMEGFVHWAGIRRNGEWFPKHVKECTNIGAIESTGEHLLLGSTYEGEAAMFFGGQGIVAVDRETGAFVKGIGFTNALQPSGMILQLRHDPFTGDVWAATPYALWRIGADLELKEQRGFADVFDAQSNTVVTRLAEGAEKTDHLAQFVRAMNIREPQAVYAFLKAHCAGEDYPRCGYSLMYNLGMTSSYNWSEIPGAEALLPHFVEAAAYANDGKPSLMFIEEITGFQHRCTVNENNLTRYNDVKRNAAFRNALRCFKAAGIPVPTHEPMPDTKPPHTEAPLAPSASTFGAPPREGLIRRDGYGETKIHAAWFAWQGGVDENGEYTYRKHCVDFDTTRPGSDGYYRFEARRFERPGDWFGAETTYVVEADGAHLEIDDFSPAPSLFDLPPGRLVEGNDRHVAQRIVALAERCHGDGVANADLTAALETKPPAEKPVVEAHSEPRYALIPPQDYSGPLLRFAGGSRAIIGVDQAAATFTVNVIYYDALDPKSFRATFLGADVTEQFQLPVPGIESVELSGPRGRHELVITARRRGADPDTPPETFTQPVVIESLTPMLDVTPAVRPGVGTERPRMQILKPEISVERIALPIPLQDGKKEEQE